MKHCLPLSRRMLLAASLCLAAALPAMKAQAQAAFPSKPVKFVNSFPPGGPSDILARSVADILQAMFKQPVLVENKPGASGNIGADLVAKSPPDGYTVLFGIDTTVTVNPHIYKGMPFKPADLKPVMIMASSGLLVGVHPSTGFKSLSDLIAAGRSKGLNFSSAGSGSPGHVASAVITEATDVKINNIFYKGNTPAVMAVLSGEVDG
ncbi:MAG TPA: tripartite tricarboxylate transporter substrate binding protein, partial [Ramlibacter sp.]|nr:tripartite tricarboxylate transporter substrate binding protein [Ramlibacter sp.]